MTMNALTPEEIRGLSSAVGEVTRIDSTIEWLGRDVENEAADVGRKVRDALGRNRMAQFTDAQLGEIVFCAVINALLARRESVVRDVSTLVKFPEPPCPRQVPDLGDS